MAHEAPDGQRRSLAKAILVALAAFSAACGSEDPIGPAEPVGSMGFVETSPDTREIRLPAGIHHLRVMDVAALIDPTTLHLKSLTDATGLRILEQNYEYDLLTSQKLMEKYVGRKVRLYQGSSWIEATLLSTNGPVFEINGQIHLGHHGQMVLPALPENLVSKPTLVWLLRNRAPAPQRLRRSLPRPERPRWRSPGSACRA